MEMRPEPYPKTCCYNCLNTTLVYSDTLFAKVKSLKGNKCTQLFCSEGYILVYPMSSKSEARVALQEFIKDVGIPNEMVCDGAGEQVGPKSDFIKACRRVHYKMRRTEPHSPWQNQAEGMIGETKKRWKTKMSAKNVPGRVWDYGLVHESTIMSHTHGDPTVAPDTKE